MKRMAERIMGRYGTDMVLFDGSAERTVRGFFRAVTSTGWQSLESVATPLGEVLRGQYVYIGPGDVAVREGDTLTVGETSYLFRRVEPFRYGDEVVYLRGLCVEKGVNDTWGIPS